ncbi:Septal ring factor EnvC, activator of murein hydrolases AmiA and AmiB [Paenibacillus sp. UNCCL117]|uniref:murein hydrolase activator EnvC family protein n=1 Tax=unclassified Paenibacillus TaxID=185978 RepID=UPI000891F081|nr:MULTISPECIES: peptidoglycan DD-metalloendopeptidase family protein [unclassified Paenibacillus]SDE50848.1 Septal ring factor EnvC, activator of murein hydrolases AmiA and AmiB [Paenibacillus sp. cl123]SFW67269.1 Septal ring factor EnvC, activator of murein hydrolases AmiA and AmiB [Paenibacillus sp. UNCCL117]
MKKSFLPLVLSVGLVGTLIVPQSGFALTASQRIEQELKQLKQTKAAVEQKVNDTEKQLNQVATEKQQTEKDIDTLLAQIDTTNQSLNELNDKVENVSTSLQENAVQLEEAEGRIVSRDQLLRSRVRLMYMNGVVSYADVLLSSTSFSDFLDRLEALRSIVNQDKEILEANKRDRDTIAVKQVEIEKQLTEVKNLYAQTTAIKADLVVKEKEKEVRIASLSEKEKELHEISEEVEKQLLKVASQEAAKQKALKEAKAAEAAKKTGKASAPVYTYGGGKFGYPLPKVVNMSSDFGTRKDPFTGRSSTHNGIDFPSPAGTSILAAEDGVVIVASWWSGYGNTVIIDHGKGVWTLYGHIRNDGIVVQKGDTVKRGQKVAEVGSTGRSTGNHLHFEVRINESPVDPKPYLR